MASKRLDNGARKLEWLKVADLRISTSAQRDHGTPGALALIGQIVSLFDPDRFGTLTVNERDGVFWVVDGGHRRSALQKMGYDDQYVQCWVYHGLSEEQEADLFLDLNNVRPVNAMDKFKVAVVANRELETAVENIVAGLGMNVGSGRTGSIRCATALLKVYTLGGPQVLESTLRIIRDAYGDAGFSARVTTGLGLFVANYGDKFSPDRLVAKLSRKLGGVNGLLGRAEQIKSSHGVNGAVGVAAAATEFYNQGRGGDKLVGWWASIEEAKDSS